MQINQIFDAWFNKGFRGSKCKTLLKLASSRIKLLRNKREAQLKQLRKEIAQLLENGQESTALIRVEHIIRENNIMDAYEILGHFCELLIVRMPIMEYQRACPIDLKEAVASLIFAAPRASDLPELSEVQNMLAFKYGRDFVQAATELRPDCGVNRLVIEKLSVRAPAVSVKLNLMKEIAEQYKIEWDPESTELELSEAPQDLLEGPNQFIGPIQMSPIPRHDDGDDDSYAQESVSSRVQESVSSSSHRREGSVTPSLQNPQQPAARTQSMDDQMEPRKFVPFAAPPPNYEIDVGPRPNYESGALAGRFYSPPRESSITQQSDLLEETLSERSHSRTKSEGSMDLHDIIEAAEEAALSAEKAAQAARAAAELARSRLSPKSPKSIFQEEGKLQNDKGAPSTLGVKGRRNSGIIHLNPDSYDWTQEDNGEQQQTNAKEEREEETGHSETLFTPNSYDWRQDSYGKKREEYGYDWTQDSYGRKQEATSLPYDKGWEQSAEGKDYGYRDKNGSVDKMPSLDHHQTSIEQGESFFTPSSGAQGHDGGSHQPIFDGSETVTYPELFRRRSSLEEDPYYSYPNLFSKSTSSGA